MNQNQRPETCGPGSGTWVLGFKNWKSELWTQDLGSEIQDWNEIGLILQFYIALVRRIFSCVSFIWRNVDIFKIFYTHKYKQIFCNNFLITFTLYMNKLYKKPGQYMWPDTNEISLLYGSVFRNFRTAISWLMVLLSTVVSKPAGWIKFKKLQNIGFSQTIISSYRTEILICVN